MGRKLGEGSAPFLGRAAGSPYNTKYPGLRPTSMPSGILIRVAIWPQQLRAKIGGSAPLGRGAGSPSNTMWPGSMPTCMLSFILIRPTVCGHTPTSQQERQDRQDRQTGQRSDSIGRTFLQTVAQEGCAVAGSHVRAMQVTCTESLHPILGQHLE